MYYVHQITGQVNIIAADCIEEMSDSWGLYNDKKIIFIIPKCNISYIEFRENKEDK